MYIYIDNRSKQELLVAIARRLHLFPFRTEKLSSLAPMVLPLGGRVGRCQFNILKKLCIFAWLFFVFITFMYSFEKKEHNYLLQLKKAILL